MAETKQPPTLTVGELIEELRKFDPKLYVTLEGCDCINDAKKVEVDEWHEKAVLIRIG